MRFFEDEFSETERLRCVYIGCTASSDFSQFVQCATALLMTCISIRSTKWQNKKVLPTHCSLCGTCFFFLCVWFFFSFFFFFQGALNAWVGVERPAQGKPLPAQIQSTVAFMLNADRFSVLGNGSTWFETGFVCLCVLFGNIQCFCSRSDVRLFLAMFSQEPLAGFNCLVFLPCSTCVHVDLSACPPPFALSASLLYSWHKPADTPSSPDGCAQTFSQRRARTETSNLFTWQDFPNPPRENSAGGESREFVSVAFSVYLSFSVCLCDRGTKERGKLLLFKTSRGELKLQNHS